MQGAVLAKLSRPRLRSPVARTRLFQRLDELRSCPLIWVSGPPGAGKTTLVASYLEERGVDGIWCRLDAGDRDVSRLFHYLREAATRLSPAARALPMFVPAALPDLCEFTRRFFRALFLCLPRNTALVLDDWQEAAGDALHTILRETVAEVPDAINMVAIGRMYPPAKLARSIAHGQVGEIGWDELKLSVQETAAIFATEGCADAHWASALHARCDGWIGGLMLSLAAAKNNGCGTPVARLEPRAILFDYFAEEVFERLPPAARELLLSTALLPSLTPQMAIEMSGNPAAPEILDDLYRNQSFIARASRPELVYKYHDLLRDFLGERLASQTAEEACSELRARAAALLEKTGDVDSAVTLYAEGGDVAKTTELILACAKGLVCAGHQQTLGRWLSLLPETVVAAQPWLSYWRGETLARLAPTEAKVWFAAAYRGFVARQDRRGQLRAAVAAAESIVSELGSYRELDGWIDALEPHIVELAAFEEESETLRAWSVFVYAAICRCPGHRLIPFGVAWLSDRLLDESPTPAEALTAGVVLMLYACCATDHELAGRVIARVQHHANGKDAPSVKRWLWFYWLGFYRIWRVEYSEAAHCWNTCAQIGVRENLGRFDFLVHASLAFVDLVEDRLTQAEDRLAHVRRAVEDGGQQIAAALYWLGETFLRLYRGARAEELLPAMDRLLESGRAAGLFHLEMLAVTDVAALCLLQGQNRRAEQLLGDAEEKLSGTIMRLCDGQVSGLKAALAFRRGDVDAAHRALEAALDASRRSGACGCLLWIRSGLGVLFSEALSDGRRNEFIGQLIRRHQVPPPSPLTEPWPWPVRIRALGALEVEIDGRPWRPEGKPQHKVLDLLKALLAEGGREVNAELVIDRLWPDAEGDAAHSNLRGTVKRLREMLGHAEAVRLFDGKLSLNDRVCWVDIWAFEAWAPGDPESAPVDEGSGQDRAAARAFSLYRGALLGSESAVWLNARRRRERARYVRVVSALGERHEAAGNHDAAMKLYERALEIDPGADALASHLTRCLRAQNAKQATGTRAQQTLPALEPSAFERPKPSVIP